MSESATSRPAQAEAVRLPRTVEELLDREEALALQRIGESMRDLGEDLSRATGLRQRIRSHPFLAAGLGACLGFAGGPLALRACKRALSLASSTPFLGALKTRALPGVVLAALRRAQGLH
jgi:hypothetical protein